MKKNGSKLPQQSEQIVDNCELPRSVLGIKYWSPNALQNVFSSKCDEQENINRNGLKSPTSNVLQTKDNNLKKVPCLEARSMVYQDPFKNNETVNIDTMDEKVCCIVCMENKND